MLVYIILFWVLQRLSAPTWCWIVWWAAVIIKIAIAICQAAYKAGKNAHY